MSIVKGVIWPGFRSVFLESIKESVKRSSKAIKHSVRRYRCNKVYEVNRERDQEAEILELSFILYSCSGKDIDFTCSFWDDRWVLLIVRKSTKSGWANVWRRDGRVGDTHSREISGAILSTLRLSFKDAETRTCLLEEIWANIVLQGPK